MDFGDGTSFQVLNTLRFLQRNLLFLSQEIIKPEGACAKMYERYVLMRLEGRDVEGKFQNHGPGPKVGAMTGRSAQERAPAQLRCRSLHQASPRNITPCNTGMEPSIQKLSHARCRSVRSSARLYQHQKSRFNSFGLNVSLNEKTLRNIH